MGARPGRSARGRGGDSPRDSALERATANRSVLAPSTREVELRVRIRPDGVVTGRPPCGFRRDFFRDQQVVGPVALRGVGRRWYGRGFESLLVPGQPVPRVLREPVSQEDRGFGRSSPDSRGRVARQGRKLEPRGSDPVRSELPPGRPSRFGLRRRGLAGDEARRRCVGGQSPLARFSAGRPAVPVSRPEQSGDRREERHLCGLFGRGRAELVFPPTQRCLHPPRAPALLPGEVAARPALRPKSLRFTEEAFRSRRRPVFATLRRRSSRPRTGLSRIRREAEDRLSSLARRPAGAGTVAPRASRTPALSNDGEELPSGPGSSVGRGMDLRSRTEHANRFTFDPRRLWASLVS